VPVGANQSLSYPPIPGLDLGAVVISLHGILAGVGIAAGMVWYVGRVRRTDIDPEAVISVLAWGAVGALVGMRLVTIPLRIADPGFDWLAVVDPTGSNSMLGGVVLGVGAGAFRAWRLGLPMRRVLDLAGAPLALGQAIGRLGDLAIVEHLGSPTTFALGYQLRPGYDVAPQHDLMEALCEAGSTCGPYHNTALYDMVGLLVLAWVLWRVTQRVRPGALIAVWAIWYGMQRFVVDFARLGAARDGLAADSIIGPWTASQWGGLALAASGLAVVIAVQRARIPEMDPA
jgi:prolipoprotein diacylglyceryltransferase